MISSMLLELPIRTSNPLNGSQGFSRGAAMGAAAKRKAQRTLARLSLWANLKTIESSGQPLLPCTVILTRIAPSKGLDDDALPAACKGIRDGVTDALGLKDDRHPGLTWKYDQRRGKQREYAVIVEIRWT